MGLTNTLLEIKQDKAILHRRTPLAVTLGQACSIPIPPSSQPPKPTCRQIHLFVRYSTRETRDHPSTLLHTDAFLPPDDKPLPFNSRLFDWYQLVFLGTQPY